MVVGVLAVGAVALAAGASSSVLRSAGGGGPMAGTGSAVGSSGSSVAIGGVVWLVVLAALLVGGAWLALRRLRSGGDAERLRRWFVVLVLGVAVFVASVLLVAVRVFGDGEGPGRQAGVGGALVQRQPDASTGFGGPSPELVGGFLLALAVAGLAVVAWRRLRVDEDAADAIESSPEPASAADEEETGPERDADAFGAAAGDAASSLAGTEAPADDDVLRAWRDLAAVLPVSRPASSTPREFARAARAAGVDGGDVAELTALFEAVRYGDREVTEERARRAVAALERIEASSAATVAPTSTASAERSVDDDRAGGDGEVGESS